MSEIAHTPGPWCVEEWSCHAKTSVLVDDPTVVTGKRRIAECETEDDARAIAAVPELIVAVLAAERVLARAGWRPDNTMDPEAVAFAKLQRAIAKAKGA